MPCHAALLRTWSSHLAESYHVDLQPFHFLDGAMLKYQFFQNSLYILVEMVETNLLADDQ